MNPLIIQAEGMPKTQDSILNYQLAKDMHIPMTEQIPPLDNGIIIDCIYGTGFHAPFSPQARKYAQSINVSRLPVFALDIPSGVNADDGTFDEDAVKADFTISFDSLKPAHTLVSSLPFCGKIICASIGIPEHWRQEALKNS